MMNGKFSVQFTIIAEKLPNITQLNLFLLKLPTPFSELSPILKSEAIGDVTQVI